LKGLLLPHDGQNLASRSIIALHCMHGCLYVAISSNPFKNQICFDLNVSDHLRLSLSLTIRHHDTQSREFLICLQKYKDDVEGRIKNMPSVS